MRTARRVNADLFVQFELRQRQFDGFPYFLPKVNSTRREDRNIE
jgi:hypothetical protein